MLQDKYHLILFYRLRDLRNAATHAAGFVFEPDVVVEYAESALPSGRVHPRPDQSAPVALELALDDIPRQIFQRAPFRAVRKLPQAGPPAFHISDRLPV